MSRYRDNVYFAMVEISPLLEAPILFIIEKVTEVLYSIRLKWEPHSQVTTWGESSMLRHGFHQSFGLQRKGVVRKLSEVVNGTVTAEWEQWVDTHSPNARSKTLIVLLSYVLSSPLCSTSRYSTL